MTRAVAVALVALALTAGLALRTARLAERPMHHDEANQAVKFGALLEHGEYRYDARDHHGPTLYYLTLASAWLRGQHTLALLDEATLRGVPVVFGAATILLLPLLSAGIGRTAVVTAALLMALSPAMVFYSRMYIQEALFACFALAFVIGVGRVATGGGVAWAAMTGVAAGLAMATKETAAIVVPSAVAAGAIAWWPVGAGRPRNALIGRHLRRATLVGLAAAAGVAALFYSSFFTAPAAMLEPFRAAGTYLDRGIDPSSHTQPWHYYLQLLTYSASGGLRWSEGLVLALAVVGTIAAWRRSDGSSSSSSFWPRYLAGYVVIAGAYLFGDSLQDALEPAAVLCRRVRARRGRVRGAREQEPLALGQCVAGQRPRGRIHSPRVRRPGARRSPTPPIRAIRTSTPRPFPTPSAWRRASAISPRSIPMARGCRCR